MKKTLEQFKEIVANQNNFDSWDIMILYSFKGSIITFTDLANKMYYEQSEVVNVEMANIILKARDAFIEEDYDEVWHQIYAMACPAFDEFEPWAELERITKQLPKSVEI